MVFILDLFAKKKDNEDLFAKPTSFRCRKKVLEEFGDRKCGGTIFERADGSKFCGLCNHPFTFKEESPP